MTLQSLNINKLSWEKAAERFFGRNPFPEYGPLAPNEENLQLIGDVTHLKVLDIGCGSGHSLKYMDSQKAGELWGLDLSSKQIAAAKALLINCHSPVKLFQSPMEHDPGLPKDYFDVVYSIYALGWTTNLDQTLANIHSYLKPGGVFVFSWEHPLYNRIRGKNGILTVEQSYHHEGPYEHEAWADPAIMQQFKVSTYINSLINNGFQIEKMIEDVTLKDEDVQRHTNEWYSYEKARFIPTTMIIKCKKS
ncbi:class I SAM-dependent methyltransferase [Halalkalibacter urbisdiaboli]|uniref:class I SAM-dependent methyltransferase n=1 Tax=Halalkalibacter urbisdiaboli TaxID=1960589 RepID=UPI000B43CC4F|nr:class I SAM-dependent methyltransferase [Halalkalibacter urbisdiaboli]